MNLHVIIFWFSISNEFVSKMIRKDDILIDLLPHRYRGINKDLVQLAEDRLLWYLVEVLKNTFIAPLRIAWSYQRLEKIWDSNHYIALFSSAITAVETPYYFFIANSNHLIVGNASDQIFVFDLFVKMSCFKHQFTQYQTIRLTSNLENHFISGW